MVEKKICLGPYEIRSQHFPGQTGPTIINHQKTRRIAIIRSLDSEPQPPTADAELVHEVRNADCAIEWYECKETLGRTYTFLVSGCSILVTSFENGLLKDYQCDGGEYGSKSFCFGKVYSGEENPQIFESNNECSSIFDFDGHIFTINGISIQTSDIFDCQDCWPREQIVAFGGPPTGGEDEEDEEEPPPPPPPEEEDEESSGGSEGTPVDVENRVDWGDAPSTWTTEGIDVICGPAQALSKSDASCESHNNPSVITLPSGHALIAYEERDKDGDTKISLAYLNTSVQEKVVYYRSLSKGTLVNEPSVYLDSTFEVFDDLLIYTSSGGVPLQTLYVGFLTGPLRGKKFRILLIERKTDSNGRPRHEIKFDPGGISSDFSDSNSASDVEWFLTQSATGDPGNSASIQLLTLPEHTYGGSQVPVSNPSIAVAQNNLMIGTDQHVFITYQAFESRRWKVYLIHIILTDRSTSSPTYLLPYQPQIPTTTPSNVAGVFSEAKYTLLDSKLVSGTPDKVCALFLVELEDGRPVSNCDQTASIYTTGDCDFEIDGHLSETGVSLDPTRAYIVASYNLDASLCGVGSPPVIFAPDWYIGSIFYGNILPEPSQLGCTGQCNLQCFGDITAYPNINEWCYPRGVCNQISIFEDPYCPDAYRDFINVTYKPEDLWLIRSDNTLVTRVKYHLSASILGTEESAVDFLFLIDHSGSMAGEIANVRLTVPVLSQSLVEKGIDVRFGFVVYARGEYCPFLPAPNEFLRCDHPGSDLIFDALQGSNECRRTDCGALPSPTVAGGFTRNVTTLQNALCCWGVCGGLTKPWISIQYALRDSRFQWRSEAKKYVMIITDANSETSEEQMSSCGGFSNTKNAAQQALLDDGVMLIAVTHSFVSDTYTDVVTATGWGGATYYDIASTDFSSAFRDVAANIEFEVSGINVLERDEAGYHKTFMHNAETLITYTGDLSDYWTYDKSQLRFTDTPPVNSGPRKGLSNFPFSIHTEKIYDVDPVHVSGDIEKWVYFDNPGKFSISFPSIGHISPNRSQPVLISDYASRPKIRINNRNEIIIAYENYELGYPQIEIKGTGDFHQNSITGPKAERITKLITQEDFSFRHTITLPDERLNQLCDFVIDNSDVTHITWQSSQDNSWEIYYANSYNLFEPVRITKLDSRSGFPKIDVHDDGTVYIVFHDNRFGPYEVMLSYKDEIRVLPLLEQDAYMASMRANYIHYTNILPIFVENRVGIKPAPAKLFATKIASIEGNDDENYIFEITNGTTIGGGDTSPHEILALAGAPSGYMYGFTVENKLLLIDVPELEDPDFDIEVSEIQVIGTVNILPPYIPGDLIMQDLFDNGGSTTTEPIDLAVWDKLTGGSGYWEFRNAVICENWLTISDHCPIDQSAGRAGQCSYLAEQTHPDYQPDVRIETKLKWYYDATDPDMPGLGPAFRIYCRSSRISDPSSNPPYPCYQIEIRPFVDSDTELRVMFVSAARVWYRNGITYTGAAGFDVPFTKIPGWWSSGQEVVVQVDCLNEGAQDVRVKVRFDGILVHSALHVWDDALSYQKPILSSDTEVFSFGFRSTIHTYVSTLYVGTVNLHFVSNYYRAEKLGTYAGTSTIIDASQDDSSRLWCLARSTNITEDQTIIKIVDVSKSNATVVRETTISTNPSKIEGALAVSHINNRFFVVLYEGGNPKLLRSSYPIIGTSIDFNFEVVNSQLAANITAMSFNHNGDLYGIDENKSVWRINQSDGSLISATEEVAPEDPYEYLGALPVAKISGFAHHYTGEMIADGEAGFFHVLVNFYDNINLEGNPFLSLNSSDNLEAFLIEERTGDPYLDDVYFAGARGIYLGLNDSGVVFFDASHFRPGGYGLAYPYGFMTNQTYFPQVSLVSSAGSITPVLAVQAVSFSCNKCTTLGDNIFDFHGCSYSFTATSVETDIYRFVVDFFADQEHSHLVQRYVLDLDSNDLSLFEINNESAADTQDMTVEGISIPAQASHFIQVYPPLDPNTGLLCGVDYYVLVGICPDHTCSIVNIQADGLTLETPSTFRCECSSTIFNNLTNMSPLSQVSRWHSSGQGFSDTRVTDSIKDSTRPSIKTRMTGAAIILFEDYNDSTTGKIKGATFRKANLNQMFGSGVRSWFDYDFNISGRDAELTTDLYDRAVTVFETPDAIIGKGVSSEELPSNTVYFKNCDFEEEGERVGESGQPCDIDKLTANVITSDPFIASQVIKKILIKTEFVEYYTYNSSGQVVPVVKDCDISLQIWATPETVAIRLKNENEFNYGNWCPFTPEISDYYIEKDWKLSNQSGIKELCIQAMTYSGVTSEFCIPVIADYDKVVYEIKLYSDSDYQVPLPTYEGLFVASTKFNETTGDPILEKTIYVEIIPSVNVESDNINFDVLQQGANDLYNLPANKTNDSTGRIVFRGEFSVNREDNIFNRDGLARIVARFSGRCEQASFVAAQDIFDPDKYNWMAGRSQISGTTSDEFADYRRTSGRVGTDLLIRPTEDPYFVFGDPNFFLEKKQSRQTGVQQSGEQSSSDSDGPGDGDGDGDDNGNGNGNGGSPGG